MALLSQSNQVTQLLFFQLNQQVVYQDYATDFIQSLTPPCEDGLGGVEPPVVPLGITASTITPIIIPMAVKTLTNSLV